MTEGTTALTVILNGLLKTVVKIGLVETRNEVLLCRAVGQMFRSLVGQVFYTTQFLPSVRRVVFIYDFLTEKRLNAFVIM